MYIGIMDFTNRKKNKYPECVLLAPKIDPTEDEHLSSNNQYLQISKVTAANPGKLALLFERLTACFVFGMTDCVNFVDEMLGCAPPDVSKLPKYIKSHRQSNGVSCFYYQRPFRKNKIKSANEFLDLWVEKKFLKTSVAFPGHTRRAEVTEEVVLVLNPIEMAVIGLEERNSNLAEECVEMKKLQDRAAPQSYTMSLRLLGVS
jgi:hypothetical protein